MNLRGYDPEGQVTGGQALAALLRALGVRDEDLPSTTDEQAAVYRSELARMADHGRRVLLVADNASTAAQVSPLIPARREHRLVVTSRDILAALPARQLGLYELAPGPARELISDSLTRARPDDIRPSREREALDEVVRHCGRLPLALEIAAARLTGDPGLSSPLSPPNWRTPEAAWSTCATTTAATPSPYGPRSRARTVAWTPNRPCSSACCPSTPARTWPRKRRKP